jgi:hypothetical protein
MRGIFLALTFISFLGCQRSQSPGAHNESNPIENLNDSTLQVVDSKGQPIVGAKVMIGDVSSGRQLLLTDKSGVFAAPENWTQAETVSIVAQGYIRTSFFNQMPRGQIYQLRVTDKTPSLEVSGTTDGFAPYMVEKDGNVDFALIASQFNKDDLYFFNETNVLSTENDYIEVFNQKIPVPSNISLPTQKEKYGFVSFTLDKPNYRLKVSEPGPQQFIAIRARTTVKTLKNQPPPLELLNEVTIGGGSQRTAVVSNKGASLNFAIGELQFDSKISVTAPEIPAQMLMLTLPLVQSGDLLFPTDVKSMESKQSRQLSIPSTGFKHLLNIVTAEDRLRVRGATANLMDASNISKPLQFLGLIPEPIASPEKITATLPVLPSGTEPGGMYVTYSKVDLTKVADVEVQKITRLWEMHLPSWSAQINVPKLPDGMGIDLSNNSTETIKYRWEVSFMASDNVRVLSPDKKLARDVLKNLVQDISYVSRNSVDL